MRYLTIAEVLHLHSMVTTQQAASSAVRDLGALESSVAQPQATFGGADLYPGVPEKAAALCFSLVRNHPFQDGNKRTGHAAMEVFLALNGFAFEAPVDEQEQVMLQLAAGVLSRELFHAWVVHHAIHEPGDGERTGP